MKIENLGKLILVICVATIMIPKIVGWVQAVKEWREAPPRVTKPQTDKEVGRQSETEWIRPGEIRRIPTYRRGWRWEEPSGIVAVRGITAQNGSEEAFPLNASRANRVGWNEIGKTGGHFFADPGIYEVMDFMEVSVPPNCPPSTFKLVLE